jgi:hypothetical protein
MPNAEQIRLQESRERAKHWRRWGPYLADRQWGTVREDYSASGDAWSHITHDMARSYAYRWGEDGLAGWCDNHQRLCLGWAFWNGHDPILKERLFGLDNHEGNHGEDVKECYWHLDGLPTHAYARYLYRYPQRAYPYAQLIAENERRDRTQPEYELEDTGAFAENRYFDITIEYAKADAEDIAARVTVKNCGPEPATIHVLPQLWFRNTWNYADNGKKPRMEQLAPQAVEVEHAELGVRYWSVSGDPIVLFTENDTNRERLYGEANPSPHVKDGFHRYVVEHAHDAVHDTAGTKCAAWYQWLLEPGEERDLHLRLHDAHHIGPVEGHSLDPMFEERRAEADAYYDAIGRDVADPEHRAIQRSAFAGLLWTKQFYHYVVEDWLDGDRVHDRSGQPRAALRNREWRHLYNDDVLLMPDSWEYPWYAVWDSAFHAMSVALIDPEYAKQQLSVFTREWYMHPNGQLPAYEWALHDVNPPVHAFAAWRVYQTELRQTGQGDRAFLESVFHKLLMNFTWWVNRKDLDGNNVFQGGFLGMDNIGVFDRSREVPLGGFLEQSDGTSWMAMYCLNMLRIAWELAKENSSYEDIASKFFEHFLHISHAMHNIDHSGDSLWDDADGFYYDQLRHPEGHREPLRIRSMVGLIPLFAVEIIDNEDLDALPGFKRRMDWFYDNRPDLTRNMTCSFEPGRKGRCMLSLMNETTLVRVVQTMLDEAEFLSPFGIRSLSKHHEAHPFVFESGEYRSTVSYEPGDSTSPLFGGNSNWRGPIWFPVNYLLIQSLRRYHAFYGDNVTLEFPAGSGNRMHLGEIANEVARRLVKLFEAGNGVRPSDHGADSEPRLFHEYFHADTGRGLGANHQTGWTSLVANLIEELGNLP